MEEESIHVLDISNAPTPMQGTSFVRGVERDSSRIGSQFGEGRNTLNIFNVSDESIDLK